MPVQVSPVKFSNEDGAESSPSSSGEMKKIANNPMKITFPSKSEELTEKPQSMGSQLLSWLVHFESRRRRSIEENKSEVEQVQEESDDPLKVNIDEIDFDDCNGNDDGHVAFNGHTVLAQNYEKEERGEGDDTEASEGREKRCSDLNVPTIILNKDDLIVDHVYAAFNHDEVDVQQQCCDTNSTVEPIYLCTGENCQSNETNSHETSTKSELIASTTEQIASSTAAQRSESENDKATVEKDTAEDNANDSTAHNRKKRSSDTNAPTMVINAEDVIVDQEYAPFNHDEVRQCCDLEVSEPIYLCTGEDCLKNQDAPPSDTNTNALPDSATDVNAANTNPTVSASSNGKEN